MSVFTERERSKLESRTLSSRGEVFLGKRKDIRIAQDPHAKGWVVSVKAPPSSREDWTNMGEYGDKKSAIAYAKRKLM